MIAPSLAAVLLAGLAGSPHCMAMCGGFAGVCSGRWSGPAWHAGRLTTYALLGALAGVFGAFIPGPPWVAPVVSGLLMVGFAAVLAGVVPAPVFRIRGLTRVATRLARSRRPVAGFLFGMTTSLLPCGLIWAALAIPVASGSAAVGALSMVVFGLGTVPALSIVTIGLRRWVERDVALRRGLAAAVLLAGLISIGIRAGGTSDSMPHVAHGDAAAHSASHEVAR